MATLRLGGLSLGAQIIGLAVVAALLGGGVVGLVVSHAARTTLREYLNGRVLSTADYAAQVTLNYFANARAASRDLANGPVMQIAADAGNLRWTATELRRWQSTHPAIEVDVTDTQGVLIATSADDESLIGQTLPSAPEWLPGAMANVTPYLGRPGREDITQTPRVPYAVRITDRLGNVRGVLVASISLETLSNRLSAIAAGPNARTTVIDLADDIVVAHPDPTRILTPRTGHNEAMSRVHHGVVPTTAANGERDVSAESELPTMGWLVMVNEPVADAFAPLDVMTQEAFKLMAGVVLAAVTVATLLALRIVRPVRRLRATAEAMAAGDLSQRTCLIRCDEIGQLATSFDYMADQLQATVVRANESEARIRNVMDSVAEAIITVDPEGKIDGSNPAAERLFGYPGALMIGLPIERLLPSYPEREQEGCRLDGTRMPLEVIATQSMVDGQPRSIIVARDVSERKRAERQREELAQSEKLRALGQLASGIAHLVTDTRQDARGRDEVAQRLMSFMGTPSGAESERCDLSSIVSDAVQLTAPRWRDATQAEGRPVRLSIEREAQPIVQGLPARLCEAISNLIYNAVDALPTGGNIRVRLSADHRHAILEVTDSGIGMSSDLQERIFEPFFTTKSASKGASRTGLGLSMVFGIVEHHSGRIEVESALGHGSTFRIKLPLSSVISETVRLRTDVAA